MTKQQLRQEVTRYITLLSHMARPPIEHIEDMHYFIGLIDTANPEELIELVEYWQHIKPADRNSVEYIEAGKEAA